MYAALMSAEPDPDHVECRLREASQLQAGQRLKGVPARVDEEWPAPRCPKCDRPMTRQGRRSKVLDTRSGAAAVSRRCWCCRICWTGCYPSARRLGLAGCGYTPGMARMTATAVQDRSFDSAARALQELSGIPVISRTLARRTHKSGKEIQTFERTEVAEGMPASERLYLSVDGTGVPMRASETAAARVGRRTVPPGRGRLSQRLHIRLISTIRRPAMSAKTMTVRHSTAGLTAPRPPDAVSVRTSFSAWIGMRAGMVCTRPGNSSSFRTRPDGSCRVAAPCSHPGR